MRALTVIFATAAVFVIGLNSDAKAQGSWCSWYDRSTYNCGFYTFEQCMANVSGIGGICRPNYFEPQRTAPPKAKPRKRKRSSR